MYQNSLDFNVVKAVIDKGEVNTTASIEPNVLEEKLTLQVHQLVNGLAGKMTRQQWKSEQENDSEKAPVLSLVKENIHLQYQIQKTDETVSKILLRFRDNLCLVGGLLYRKWVYKEEIFYLKFVLPKSFPKKTILACHDHFGHLGIDKMLLLL